MNTLKVGDTVWIYGKKRGVIILIIQNSACVKFTSDGGEEVEYLYPFEALVRDEDHVS